MTGEDYIYVLHARSLVHTGEDVVVVHGVGGESFTLLECIAPVEAEFQPGERVAVSQPGADRIDHVQQRVTYDNLSQVAREALEEAVIVLVERNADRFVDVFNMAQPLSLRRHQLDLLPQVGEARRNQILQERDRRPFDSFADLTNRIQGLAHPEALIAQRIETELSSDECSGRLFVE